MYALLGGAVIGLSAAALLFVDGRIAGVSGIVGGLLTAGSPGDRWWRALFVAGLVAGGLVLRATSATPFHGLASTPVGILALAGFLVGLGSTVGNGCTSGHGVCGVSRFSPRSIVATVTFMLVGGMTVYVVRHLLGVAP